MATSTIKQLIAPTALSATLTTTLYTVPASTTTMVQGINICNTETSAVTVSIFVGTSATIANALLDALSFAPGETKFFSFPQTGVTLVAADQIRGGASSASAVAINASGVEVA